MSCDMTATKEWISPPEGAKMLGLTSYSFKKNAARLGIRCREIPGRIGKLYRRSDVERAIAALEKREEEQLIAAQSLPERPKRIGRPPKVRTKNETARPR